MLYKDHLKDGIKIVKNHHDTIIGMKLDHTFVNVVEDVYMCIFGLKNPRPIIVILICLKLLNKVFLILILLDV